MCLVYSHGPCEAHPRSFTGHHAILTGLLTNYHLVVQSEMLLNLITSRTRKKRNDFADRNLAAVGEYAYHYSFGVTPKVVRQRQCTRICSQLTFMYVVRW